MPQTRGRIFDDFASLMTNAAGVANGVKREAETAVRTQVERILSGMNVVTREEFEAVRDMAALAREENEDLRRRIAALEAKLAEQDAALRRVLALLVRWVEDEPRPGARPRAVGNDVA